jgi:hypothetical protein
MSAKTFRHCPNPDCVVKVGDGRGFVIVNRVKLPPLQSTLKLRKKVSRRTIDRHSRTLPALLAKTSACVHVWFPPQI